MTVEVLTNEEVVKLLRSTAEDYDGGVLGWCQKVLGTPTAVAAIQQILMNNRSLLIDTQFNRLVLSKLGLQSYQGFRLLEDKAGD